MKYHLNETLSMRHEALTHGYIRVGDKVCKYNALVIAPDIAEEEDACAMIMGLDLETCFHCGSALSTRQPLNRWT